MPICFFKVPLFFLPLSLSCNARAHVSRTTRDINSRNSPRSVAFVGQGHVARAQPMEAPQHRHRGADAVATLYSHQAGDHPVPMSVFQLAARRHQADSLGVARRESAHHIDLLESELHGVQELCLTRHVGRPELRADDTLLQANQIGLPFRAPAGVARQVLVEGEILQLRAAAVLAKMPGEVVVSDGKISTKRYLKYIF